MFGRGNLKNGLMFMLICSNISKVFSNNWNCNKLTFQLYLHVFFALPWKVLILDLIWMGQTNKLDLMTTDPKSAIDSPFYGAKYAASSRYKILISQLCTAINR